MRFNRFNRKYDATEGSLRFLILLAMFLLWYVPIEVGVHILATHKITGLACLGLGTLWCFIMIWIAYERALND